jgi:hypothetical protein
MVGKSILNGFGLWSASGRSGAESGETAGTKPERNAAAEPQTEASR